MHWNRLGLRDRRALAVGVVLIGCLLAVRTGPAWLAWRAAAVQSAREAAAELARSEALLAGLPAAMDTLETRLTRFKELDLVAVVAETEPALQRAVVTIVEDAAHRGLIRIDEMPAKVWKSEAESLRRVSVTLRGQGDITGLAVVLRELESSPHLLAIPALTVTARDPGAGADAAETLVLEISVEAIGVLSTRDGEAQALSAVNRR